MQQKYKTIILISILLLNHFNKNAYPQDTTTGSGKASVKDEGYYIKTAAQKTAHVIVTFFAPKDTGQNTIQIRNSYMFIQTPYRGFFRNNIFQNKELFNLSGKSIQINYLRSFGKRQHWQWGLLFGYEWYKMRFYDFKDTQKDSAWYMKQYLYGTEMNNYLQTGIYTTSHLQDSMLKYYGTKIYPLEYIRLGWLLAYNFQLNKKLSLKLMLESGGTMSRNISRLNKEYSSNDILEIQREKIVGTGIIKETDVIGSSVYIDVNPIKNIWSYTPFYPLIQPFEKINKNTRNGLVRYSISLQYELTSAHIFSLDISWANLWRVNYNNIYPPYKKSSLSSEYSSSTCLGCSNQPTMNYYVVDTYLRIAINTYRYFNLSLSYNYKF